MSRGTPQRDIVALALAQHGLVTPRDVEELGIDPVRLRQMTRRRVFERVSRGVYRLAEAPPDRWTSYMAAVLWPAGERGVLSHETALDLHDLCDVSPERIDISVPSAFRVRRRAVPTGYRLHHRDLTANETTHLEGLPIVTPVRAIHDGIGIPLRSSLIRQAVDTLRRREELSPRDEEGIFAALAARRDVVG